MFHIIENNTNRDSFKVRVVLNALILKDICI